MKEERGIALNQTGICYALLEMVVRLQWRSISSVSTFLHLYFSLTQTEGKADMVVHPCSSGTWEQQSGKQECSALLGHTTAQAVPRIHVTLPKK